MPKGFVCSHLNPAKLPFLERSQSHAAGLAGEPTFPPHLQLQMQAATNASSCCQIKLKGRMLPNLHHQGASQALFSSQYFFLPPGLILILKKNQEWLLTKILELKMCSM